MFCPNCGSEYRPGYSRCVPCDVDLVEDGERGSTGAAGRRASGAAVRSETERRVSYCGFLTLDDALQARERLRRAGLDSEILIREGAGSDPQDEYWLRISPDDLDATRKLLGDVGAEELDGEVACSACGGAVAEEDTGCPHCGERFEET